MLSLIKSRPDDQGLHSINVSLRAILAEKGISRCNRLKTQAGAQATPSSQGQQTADQDRSSAASAARQASIETLASVSSSRLTAINLPTFGPGGGGGGGYEQGY